MANEDPEDVNPKKVNGGWGVTLMAIAVLILGGGLVQQYLNHDGMFTPSGPNSGIGSLFGPQEFRISVTGSKGMVFSGSYLTFTSSGSESKTIDGIVPRDIPASASTVSAVFQKKEKVGSLKLEIYRNGQLVKSAETTAEYGLVTAASN